MRTQAGFGKDTGVVEFWREEDARDAEEAMHCADVEGQNIAVQVYQPRRAGATMSEFNAAAPTFVPTGAIMPQYPTQVRVLRHHSVACDMIICSIRRLTDRRIKLREALYHLSMDLGSKSSTLRLQVLVLATVA